MAYAAMFGWCGVHDVLVVGEPAGLEVVEAAERAPRRLGLEVNPCRRRARSVEQAP